MAIVDRMKDAELLWEQGRFHGALTMILISIGATSRQRHSKDAIEEDSKAFRKFLAEEITRHSVAPQRLQINKPPTDPPALPSSLDLPDSPKWDSEDIEGSAKADEEWMAEANSRLEAHRAVWDEFQQRMEAWSKDPETQKSLMGLEQIFYKLCRCGLCHEGGVAPEVRFVEPAGCLSSKAGGQFVELSRDWIQFLAMVVIAAEENQGLFSTDDLRFWQSRASAAAGQGM